MENLTGSGEYHWMAGNFLKYGASEATFGSKNAGDLPVDAHELIALCAPRLTFISYGVPEKGDAKWLDHQGSYMAAVAAGPVFRLLGAKDLGSHGRLPHREDAAGQRGLLDGQLAWRQHDGGHTDGPNWKYFIPVGRQVLERAPSRPSGRLPGGVFRGVRAAYRSRTPCSPHMPSCWRRPGRAASTSILKATPSRAAGAPPTIRICWPTGTRTFFGWNAADFGWGADTDPEHSLASRKWRTGRRQSQGHRAARRHQQRGRRPRSSGGR